MASAETPFPAARTFDVAGDREALPIRGPQTPRDDVLSLREVAGAGVTVRVTPVDDEGAPVDGGRVIVLKANERRAVRLTDTLPFLDLLARRLVVETLDGSGRAHVAASWLTDEEAATAAAAAHVPRRHLTATARPTSDGLIDTAESSGTLDHETAVLYRVYAIFGDTRLPANNRGDDSGVPDSLFLATVISEWNSYSAATQAVLQPFLVPPAYQQGYRAAAATVAALESPPSCTLDSNWDYVENPGGKVRIWFDVTTSDRVVAGVFLLQAENTIWPKLQALMPGHLPLSDGALGCNGGSDQLDVHLCDQPQSVTVGYSGCSNSPVFIRVRRDTTAALLVDLPHLSATYKRFVFSGPEISSVAFWNGATFDLEKLAVPVVGPFWNPQPASTDAVKGIKVQALIKINGTWTQDDWTDKPYVLFCRDLKAERLEELVIVVSNSRLDDSAGSLKPPGMAPVLWVSGFGCYQWQGTATYSEVGTDNSQTDTVANLVWTRIDGAQDPPAITYLPTGNVTVTGGGTCSGGGTVPLSGLTSSLTTYNFVPTDAPSRKSYKGQGYEAATVGITCQGKPGQTFVGPWFTIFPPNPPAFPFFFTRFDGKHMTGTSSPTPGLTWQWDLHTVQQP